jgi:hypothetical protein
MRKNVCGKPATGLECVGTRSKIDKQAAFLTDISCGLHVLYASTPA